MPSVAYRLMIEGCPVEWVSEVYLEGTLSDDRERLAGLETDGLKIEENYNLKDPIASASGITFTIKHPRAAVEFATYPNMVDQLAAECAAVSPDGTKTITVRNGSNFTAGNVYHIGTEAFYVNSITDNDLTVQPCYWDTLMQDHYTTSQYSGLIGASSIYDRPPTLEGRRCYLFKYDADEVSDNTRLFLTEPEAFDYGEEYDTEDRLIWRGIISDPPSLDTATMAWRIRADSILSVLRQEIGSDDVIGYVRGIYRPYTACLGIQFWGSPWSSHTDDRITKYVDGWYETTDEFVDAINAALQEIVDDQDNEYLYYIKLEQDEGGLGYQLRVKIHDKPVDFNMGTRIVDNGLGIGTCLVYPDDDMVSEGAWGRYDGPYSTTGVMPLHFSNDTDYKLPLNRSGVYTVEKLGTLLPQKANIPNAWVNPPNPIEGGQGDERHLDDPGYITVNTDTTESKNKIWCNYEFLDKLEADSVVRIKTGEDTIDVIVDDIDTTDGWFTHDQTAKIPILGVQYLGMKVFVKYQHVFLDGSTEMRVVVSNRVGNVFDFITDIRSNSVKANNGLYPFITKADLYQVSQLEPYLTHDFYANRKFRIVEKKSVKDVLSEELKLAGFYMCLGYTGNIVTRRKQATADTSVTIDDDDIVLTKGNKIEWSRNDFGTASTIKIDDKYTSAKGEELSRNYTIRDASISVYKNRTRGEITIKPESEYASSPFDAAKDPGLFQDIGQHCLGMLNHDYEILRIPVKSDVMDIISIGTWVNLSSSYVISTTNGTYGINGRKAMVVGRSWNLDPKKGAVSILTLYVLTQSLDQSRVGWAPSALITAATLVSGNTWTCTVETSRYAPSGHYDLEYFPIGGASATIKVIKYETATATSQTGKISAVATDYTTATIVFDGTAPWGSSFTGEWVLELYTYNVDTSVKQYVWLADTDLKVFGDLERAFKVI